MNTINSPTATNLARGTIIELAQNVYNNALAAQEQADRAEGIVAGAIDRATAEADRAGVARIAAEAAASAADGAATAADGAWNAATAEANRAEAAAIDATSAAGRADGAEANAMDAENRATSAADRAEEAARRAEAAAGGGGGGEFGVELVPNEYDDGFYVTLPTRGTWNETAFIIVTGMDYANSSFIYAVVPVRQMYIDPEIDLNFTPWFDSARVNGSYNILAITGVDKARFVLYGG